MAGLERRSRRQWEERWILSMRKPVRLFFRKGLFIQFYFGLQGGGGILATTKGWSLGVISQMEDVFVSTSWWRSGNQILYFSIRNYFIVIRQVLKQRLTGTKPSANCKDQQSLNSSRRFQRFTNSRSSKDLDQSNHQQHLLQTFDPSKLRCLNLPLQNNDLYVSKHANLSDLVPSSGSKHPLTNILTHTTVRTAINSPPKDPFPHPTLQTSISSSSVLQLDACKPILQATQIELKSPAQQIYSPMREQNMGEGVDLTDEEKRMKFYQLHYPPRKQAESPRRVNHGFRARSLISVIQNGIPEENPKEMIIKHKKSHQVKLKIEDTAPEQEKPKKSKRKVDNFSFHKLLSQEMNQDQMAHYMTRYPVKSLSDVEEQSRRNITVRSALQKAKDEKAKIQKVLNSHKQSEETKLDYLQLKRKDIEQEINDEMRGIYEEFFRKEYEEVHGGRGFLEFSAKMKATMGILHQKIFSQ